MPLFACIFAMFISENNAVESPGPHAWPRAMHVPWPSCGAFAGGALPESNGESDHDSGSYHGPQHPWTTATAWLSMTPSLHAQMNGMGEPEWIGYCSSPPLLFFSRTAREEKCSAYIRRFPKCLLLKWKTFLHVATFIFREYNSIYLKIFFKD
jgi:hypothetical protein